MIITHTHKHANTAGRNEGADGPDGPKGEKGSTGVPGLPGEKGIRGRTGPVGPDGLVGPVGPMGTPGQNGTDGEEGMKGMKVSHFVYICLFLFVCSPMLMCVLCVHINIYSHKCNRYASGGLQAIRQTKPW